MAYSAADNDGNDDDDRDKANACQQSKTQKIYISDLIAK